MLVEVANHSDEHRAVIKNLMAFYRYELMPFIVDGPGAHVNGFGVIGAEGDRNHEASSKADDVWWQKPGVLFAFLIRVDDAPAGFAMVALPPHVTRGVQQRLCEFFVLNRYRGRGVGRAAALQVFDRLGGTWELGWVVANTPAALFWRSVVSGYTRDQFEDSQVGMGPEEPGIPGLRFVNEAAGPLGEIDHEAGRATGIGDNGAMERRGA
ncbi:MAG: GNAT family N-acetyltransferase [Planctomycetota bacterium]